MMEIHNSGRDEIVSKWQFNFDLQCHNSLQLYLYTDLADINVMKK